VTGKPAAHGSPADLWYVVYKDETGQTHTVKGDTTAIRDALRDGLLGDGSALLLGRSKTGQFQPVHSLAEFRDLVIAPAPLSGTVRAGRTSGPVPPPNDRPHPESGVIDLGELPQVTSGAISGRGLRRDGPAVDRQPAPASGRFQSPAPSSGVARVSRSSTHRAGLPTPVTDPGADTIPANPSWAAKPDPAVGTGRGKASFDWTPVVAVVVMLLSAAAGFLFFNR
jgi:hypothetical protein